MFSMNSWVSRESPGTSQESMKFNEFMENIGLANVYCFSWKFMENIGQANVFHEFVAFQGISWDQPRI